MVSVRAYLISAMALFGRFFRGLLSIDPRALDALGKSEYQAGLKLVETPLCNWAK